MVLGLGHGYGYGYGYGYGNGNGGETRQGQTRKTLASSNPKIGNLSFMNLQNSRRLYQNKLIRPGVGVVAWKLPLGAAAWNLGAFAETETETVTANDALGSRLHWE